MSLYKLSKMLFMSCSPQCFSLQTDPQRKFFRVVSSWIIFQTQILHLGQQTYQMITIISPNFSHLFLFYFDICKKFFRFSAAIKSFFVNFIESIKSFIKLNQSKHIGRRPSNFELLINPLKFLF